MAKLQELNTKTNPTWCPGCGNFPLLLALKNAIVKLNLDPSNVLVVSGVGCHGHLPQWLNTYGFESLHGRALPVASGAKLANHELTVIAEVGDGDCYGIGGNHFLHAARRNMDITVLAHDNGVYGLTTGQAAPTAQKGFVSKSTPFGVEDDPINPIALAIASGATFVARAFAGDVNHTSEMIAQAISHKGFALLDIFQPCVTFNHVNTYDWYHNRIYHLDGAGHDPSDFNAAWKRSWETEKVPLGVFYKTERQTKVQSFPQIAGTPLVRQGIDNVDVSPLIEEFL